MRILFASSEVAPFAKTGGLADVAEGLPRALSKIGCNLTVILPFYRSVKKSKLPLDKFSAGEYNFLRYKKGNIGYVFVDKDEYYDRDSLYCEMQSGDYADNEFRFSYFDKAVVEFAAQAMPPLDIIHLNDWQTGLVPIYLRLTKNPVKTLFTIHNIGYQGLFSRGALGALGIPRIFYNRKGMEHYGKISFLKAGLAYSSAINTVSTGYMREILTSRFGCGMERILKSRLPHVYGILNGVDYKDWDPSSDKYIRARYDCDSLEKKHECKTDLIERTGLPVETAARPIIGVISRLAEQKGIDLIAASAGSLVNMGASIVILGIGDRKYNRLCEKMASDYPGYISVHIKFDDEFAHMIEAGSDMILIPSRYEPCGLNQFYSMRYGTLPVVRATGGLDDTVSDIFENYRSGNGIKFQDATKTGLEEAVRRAISLYNDREKWQDVQKRIMKLDFSWDKSALRYKELYQKLVGS
ncbi:MAG: glycogen synthase GlgA [Candidatus Omnitrophica bacterium]|nr:glycogen synthase GlgA [Candidatus Omnitrophota bacterium]